VKEIVANTLKSAVKGQHERCFQYW